MNIAPHHLSAPRASIALSRLLCGIGALFVAGTIFGAAYLVRAQEYSSSTSFWMQNADMNEFGGFEATSTSFGMVSAGEVVAGESTSSGFSARFGPLNFDTFTPESRAWRWYDDEADETPTVSLAAESVAPTNVLMDNAIKLRMTLFESANIGGSNVKFKMQYSEASDFSSDVSDVAEGVNCLSSSPWCYADASGTDNGVISTTVLSDADSCSGGVGNGCGTHNTSSVSTSTFAQQPGAATEYEFSIKQKAASANTTYFFRAYNINENVPVPLHTTSTYPSLVTGGAALVFTVSGLPSGTSTEGVVTDASSTATAVSFGALPFSTERAAGQRLSVTTNATNGYQVFMFQDQVFQNESGIAMPSIMADNTDPKGWTNACAATSSGCYGYHAGDDSLAGGSPRFAPDDTYARFATSSEEVAFSSLPATRETTDVVFKTEIRPTQEGGTYQNRITYIAVPVF